MGYRLWVIGERRKAKGERREASCSRGGKVSCPAGLFHRFAVSRVLGAKELRYSLEFRILGFF